MSECSSGRVHFKDVTGDPHPDEKAGDDSPQGLSPGARCVPVVRGRDQTLGSEGVGLG